MSNDNKTSPPILSGEITKAMGGNGCDIWPAPTDGGHFLERKPKEAPKKPSAKVIPFPK